MVVLLVVLVIALKSKRFDPLATLLPLCFMRLALMASELVRQQKKGVPAARAIVNITGPRILAEFSFFGLCDVTIARRRRSPRSSFWPR